MTSARNAATRRPGRPRAFDREAALQTAMELFWRHGFEGTSISALTAEMGVTPTSLYAAFGDKRRLFREVVAKYTSGPASSDRLIAEAGSGREAAADLMRAAAKGFTGAKTPRGCLLASAAISCSAEAADVQEDLASIRRSIEAALRERIEADCCAGVLPVGTDSRVLAAMTMATIQGLSTLARDGASRKTLLAVVEQVMRAWP